MVWGGGGEREEKYGPEASRKASFGFFVCQETKLSNFNDRLAWVLWGEKDCKWVYSSAEGFSGGLVCIWNDKVFKRTDLWGEKGLLGVAGLWNGVLVNIVNVYSPCDLDGK